MPLLKLRCRSVEPSSESSRTPAIQRFSCGVGHVMNAATALLVSTGLLYGSARHLCGQFWLVASSKTAGSRVNVTRLRIAGGQNQHSVPVQKDWKEEVVAFVSNCIGSNLLAALLQPLFPMQW